MAATVKAGARNRRPALPPARRPEPEPSGPLHFAAPAKGAKPEPEEREALFYVGDTEYTILSDPGPGIALDARHIIATGGHAANAKAEDYVMTEMLGEQGWTDLRRYVREKLISRKDLNYLLKVVTEKAMGALEEDPDPNP
jgi:hypothetical protein